MTAAPAGFHRLPTGRFAARALGRRWIVVRRPVAGGRGWKLEAWEAGGPGHVSLNVYRLASGDRLIPCEMPVAEALAFLSDLRPDG